MATTTKKSATKAKGIRISQLAKELGYPSKELIDRCKAEDIPNAPANHQSVVSIGLEATLRDWFPKREALVEETPETEAEAKAKRKTIKKKSDEATDTLEPQDEAPVEMKTVVEAAPPPAPVEPIVAPTEEPSVPEPKVVPIAAPAPVAPAVVSPAAEAPTTTAPTLAPPPSRPAADAPRQMRPTIKLGDRPHVPERKKITPAPQLLVPEPAKIQGPRTVRIEEPDHLPAPRKQRPAAEGPSGTGTIQARPQGGRGVKSTTDEEGEDAEKKGKDKDKSNRTLSSRRRGPDGRRGEADKKLKEWTDRDLLDREERLKSAGQYHRDIDRQMRKTEARGTHALAKSTVEKGEPIELEAPVTVKTLSAALGVSRNEVVMKLMKLGMTAVNQPLDQTMAEGIALEYGLELRIKELPTLEEQLEDEIKQRIVDVKNLVPRPPVVTILGHVDHGKTSLLDKIRHANVAAGEAGGITQHTAAWTVQIEGETEGKKTTKRVTFIDTPGHQAFTSMRARGANMTDVAVLVVSAAEGVQPQTIESINHARAAGVPIVVALNKIDRPDANKDMVLGQLAAQNLNPVEWGGEIEVVPTSATTGQGIPDLIEILDYQSQLLDLKYDPTAPARGIVIESRMDEGLGPVATVLVQDGVLKPGDIVLAGGGFGRIRSLLDDRLQSIQSAGASVPVVISGMSELPSAGDKFYVVADMDRARTIATERQSRARQTHLASATKVTRENLFDTMNAGGIKTINLIIKADVQGSLETLVKSVTDQNTDEVKVRVVHSGVGAINESDVELAMATRAKPTDNQIAIIGFHVVPDDKSRALAEQNHIDVKLYRVIYEIFDDLKKALSGMLEPEEREKFHGRAEIRQVFKYSKVGSIAGCMITEGHVQRGSKIRLIRDGVVIGQDMSLETLRRNKDDVREVKQGFECGMKIANYDDIKVGDVIEAYVRETHQRTL